MDLPDLAEEIAAAGAIPSFSAGMLSSGLAAAMGAGYGQSLNQMTVAGERLSGLPGEAVAPEVIKRALSEIGMPLAVTNADGPFWGQTRAGWLSLNPAILCVMPADAGCLLVYGFAKEGLISQKTARGAVRRLKAALENQGLAFEARTITACGRLTPNRA